jgi:hypothetical protein
MRKKEMTMQLSVSRLSMLVFAAGAFCLATPAQADWIADKLSDSCSSESANAIQRSVRDNIEDSVKRAEGAIQPPSPVGDMGCLGDLMSSTGLNIFSEEQGGDFGGSMASGIVSQLMGQMTQNMGAGLGPLSDIIGGVGAGGDPMQAVCAFAEEKWAELTEGLGGMGDMQIPPNMSQAFNLGNYNLPRGNPQGKPPVEQEPPDPFPSPMVQTPSPQDPTPQVNPGVQQPVEGSQEALELMWRQMVAPSN